MTTTELLGELELQGITLAVADGNLCCEGIGSVLSAVRITLKAYLDQGHTRHGDFIESELESALLNADGPGHVSCGVSGTRGGQESPGIYPNRAGGP